MRQSQSRIKINSSKQKVSEERVRRFKTNEKAKEIVTNDEFIDANPMQEPDIVDYTNSPKVDERQAEALEVYDRLLKCDFLLESEKDIFSAL